MKALLLRTFGTVAFALAFASSALLACASIAGISDAELDQDLCTEYCDTVMEQCQGEFEVYERREICLDYCNTLPLGERGDQSGNSVACRLHHARLIAGGAEEVSTCSIAGPGGNGTCGTNCEGFCAAQVAICDPEIDEQECVEECTNELDNLPFYDTSIQRGNSVQCRLYHVSAATVNATLHCPHAAGLELCVP